MIDFWDNTTRLVGLAQLVAWVLWGVQLFALSGVCGFFSKKTDGAIWIAPPVWGVLTAILTHEVIAPAFVRLIAGVSV